jgi:hypothetical protein
MSEMDRIGRDQEEQVADETSRAQRRQETYDEDDEYQDHRNGSDPGRMERRDADPSSLARDRDRVNSSGEGLCSQYQATSEAEDSLDVKSHPISPYHSSGHRHKGSSGDRTRGSMSARTDVESDERSASRASLSEQRYEEQQQFSRAERRGTFPDEQRSFGNSNGRSTRTHDDAGTYGNDSLQFEHLIPSKEHLYGHGAEKAYASKSKRPQSMYSGNPLPHEKSGRLEDFYDQDRAGRSRFEEDRHDEHRDRWQNDAQSQTKSSSRSHASQSQRSIEKPSSNQQARKSSSRKQAGSDSSIEALVHRLRSENDYYLDKLTRTGRELDVVKTNLNSLQEAKLSNIDRFTPVVDGVIKEKFNKLEIQVKVLSGELAKSTKPDVSPKEWASRMSQHTWPGAFPWGTAELDPSKNQDFRKLAWRLIVWYWLDKAVISNPFRAFPGYLAENLHVNYTALFGEGKKAQEEQDCDFFSKFARIVLTGRRADRDS